MKAKKIMDNAGFSTRFILFGIVNLAMVTTGLWAGIVIGFLAGPRAFFFSPKCPNGL
jgi:hypothetical protein